MPHKKPSISSIDDTGIKIDIKHENINIDLPIESITVNMNSSELEEDKHIEEIDNQSDGKNIKIELNDDLHDIELYKNDESIRKEFSISDVSTNLIDDVKDFKIDIKHEPIDIDIPCEEITLENNSSTVKQEESVSLNIGREMSYHKPSSSGRQDCINKKKILFCKKRHNCSHNKKCYSITSNSKVHKRTHTGDKHYACSYCDKTFARLSVKTTHERIHTGDKPYSCSYL